MLERSSQNHVWRWGLGISMPAETAVPVTNDDPPDPRTSPDRCGQGAGAWPPISTVSSPMNRGSADTSEGLGFGLRSDHGRRLSDGSIETPLDSGARRLFAGTWLIADLLLGADIRAHFTAKAGRPGINFRARSQEKGLDQCSALRVPARSTPSRCPRCPTGGGLRMLCRSVRARPR